MAADWTLIVVASRYRWHSAPPYWDACAPDGNSSRYPLVKIDKEKRTAWYGAVLI